MTNQEALAVFVKYEEEEKNWRSARGKLAEVLQTADVAVRTVANMTKQQQELRDSIEKLAAENATLQLANKTERKEQDELLAGRKARRALATVDQELAQKHVELQDIDAQIAERSAQLKTIHAELDALKEKLHR